MGQLGNPWISWTQDPLFGEIHACTEGLGCTHMRVHRKLGEDEGKLSLERRISELELEVERLDDMIARLYETACKEQEANMVKAFSEDV